MVSVEQHQGIATGVTSPEAAVLINEFFREQVELIIDTKAQEPRQRHGKEHFRISGYPHAEIGTPEYEDVRDAREQEGYIDGLTISRDAVSGRIASANISGVLAPALTESVMTGFSNADYWKARLQFPPTHGEETPRVVLDTWLLPATHLTLVGNALASNYSPERLAAYGSLYRSIYKDRDGSGISLGAIDIKHLVLGRRGDIDTPDQERINGVIAGFERGVDDGIAWSQQLDAEITAEREAEASK